MAKVDLKLDFDESDLSDGMTKAPSRLMTAVLMYAHTKAPSLEATMKTNRPWTDRTGLAKLRLGVKVSQVDSETARLTFSHGVNYGVWLELAMEKKFAIIMPTINKEGPKVIDGLQSILGRLNQ